MTNASRIYPFSQRVEHSSFRYKRDWEKIYSEDLTANEKEKIIGSLTKGGRRSGLQE